MNVYLKEQEASALAFLGMASRHESSHSTFLSAAELSKVPLLAHSSHLLRIYSEQLSQKTKPNFVKEWHCPAKILAKTESWLAMRQWLANMSHVRKHRDS